MNEKKQITKILSEILEEVRENICDNYCKYRETADEENLCCITKNEGECPLDILC